MSDCWTIVKRDHRGQFVTQYSGELVEYNDRETVVRCIWDHDTWSLDSFSIQRGDIFFEHYPNLRWFNIMDVYSPTGQRRGWYCNLTRPAIIQNCSIVWDDLALDVIVFPDKSFILDDTFEYRLLGISIKERHQVVKELCILLDSIQHWN